MRTTRFSFHNNQNIEVFVESRGTVKAGFEVWIVGDGKGERIVLDHLITHDDFEARLCYARRGDLDWKATNSGEIPDRKTEVAIEYETECLHKGMFRDSPNDNVAEHLHTFVCMPLDRKMLNVARKAVIGTWTDGVATLILQPQNQIEIICQDASHPLFRWTPQLADAPPLLGACVADWWNFSAWYFWVFNQQLQRGEKFAIWRCDAEELHMTSGYAGYADNSFAHVYRRVDSG